MPVQQLLHSFPPSSLSATVPIGPSTTSATNKERKGNAKRNVSKYERNVNTIIANTIEGYRGTDDLDSLLSFIENKDEKEEKSNQKPKNSVLNHSDLINSNENKLKKKEQMKNKSEKVHNKLKKCSSLEELSSSNRKNTESTSKQTNNSESNPNNVTLRSKSSNTSNNTGKEQVNNTKKSGPGGSVEKAQNKRNERRSWGTEELNYLGENSLDLQKKAKAATNSSPPIQNASINKVKEPKEKVTSDSSASSTSGGYEEPLLSIESFEPSVTNAFETQEFHVVTKKRKAKRKREEDFQTNFRNASNQVKRGGDNYQNRGNYSKQHQNSHDYPSSTNHKHSQKEGKLNKNRRKSTSSVPPSEKSDDSDLDSVHSLPIKPTKSTSLLMSNRNEHNPNNNITSTHKKQKNSPTAPIMIPLPSAKQQASFQPPSSQISYADMAKKVNLNNVNSHNNSTNINNLNSNKLDKTNNSNDQWPSVSSTNKLSSTDALASTTFPFNSVMGSTNCGGDSTTVSSAVCNQQQISPPLSKKSSKLSFPELVESNNTKNKLLNNLSHNINPTTENCTSDNPPNTTELIQHNEDTNNNNNSSYTIGGEPKKIILYSQSGELDSNGNNIIKICPDDIKSNVLHKSKSFEQQSEPFPPLEKTLTKQQSQKSLTESQKLMGNNSLVNHSNNLNSVGLKGQKNENGKKATKLALSGKVVLTSSPVNVVYSEYTTPPMSCAIPANQPVLIVNTAIPTPQNPSLSAVVPVPVITNPNQQHIIVPNVPGGVLAGNPVILAGNPGNNAILVANPSVLAHNTGTILVAANPTTNHPSLHQPQQTQVTLKTSASSPANLENLEVHNMIDETERTETYEKKISKKERKVEMNGHHNVSSHQQNHQRPAVIIMNYPDRKSQEEDISSITFGFDIDQHLLHSDDDESIERGPDADLETNNENIKNSSLVNNTNYCDIIDKSEENLVVINNSCNLSSHMDNLIENQSSKSKDASVLEVSQSSVQSSSESGYMSTSLSTNPNTTLSPNQSQRNMQHVKDVEELFMMSAKCDDCTDDPEPHHIPNHTKNGETAINSETTNTLSDNNMKVKINNKLAVNTTSTNESCNTDNTSTCTTKNSLLTKEQTLVPALPVFIQPDTKQSLTFNHEKIVHFVGEGESVDFLFHLWILP